MSQVLNTIFFHPGRKFRFFFVCGMPSEVSDDAPSSRCARPARSGSAANSWSTWRMIPDQCARVCIVCVFSACGLRTAPVLARYSRIYSRSESHGTAGTILPVAEILWVVSVGTQKLTYTILERASGSVENCTVFDALGLRRGSRMPTKSGAIRLFFQRMPPSYPLPKNERAIFNQHKSWPKPDWL